MRARDTELDPTVRWRIGRYVMAQNLVPGSWCIRETNPPHSRKGGTRAHCTRTLLFFALLHVTVVTLALSFLRSTSRPPPGAALGIQLSLGFCMAAFGALWRFLFDFVCAGRTASEIEHETFRSSSFSPTLALILPCKFA
jgi:hypothetical protein